MIINLLATKTEHEIFYHELVKAYMSIEQHPLQPKVVCIGMDDRPATAEDIKDIQEQLEATAKDPNVTYVSMSWWDMPSPDEEILVPSWPDVKPVQLDSIKAKRHILVDRAHEAAKARQAAEEVDIFKALLDAVDALQRERECNSGGDRFD